jgi:hypothetical protein
MGDVCTKKEGNEERMRKNVGRQKTEDRSE